MPTNMFGQVSDALFPDGQSMIERSFNTLIPALAGADIVSGAGHVEHCYTGDLVQLVIDDDLIGMTSRVLKGINLNKETIGLDAIKRVGPGGNFLTDEHTMKYFKEEYFRPKSFNTVARDTWQAQGAKDLNENAKERVKDILNKHEVPSLPNDVKSNINSIVEEAEEYDWTQVEAASW